jgi:tetracycline repressor-like protein
MDVARDTLAEVIEIPLESAVRRIVSVAIEAHRVDPKLHRVVAEQIPRSGTLEKVDHSELLSDEGVEALVEEATRLVVSYLRA